MGTTLRADRFPAEWAVLDTRDDFMGAMAMVQQAHDLKVCLTALGAGLLPNDKVAGVALVFALFFRNIVQFLIFLS